MSITKARVLRIVITITIALLITAVVYRYWVGTSSDQDELVLYGNEDERNYSYEA